jgi:hypothetical protein
MMPLSTNVRAALQISVTASALLFALTVAGCKTNPANWYRTGYDKMLTAQNWAARKPDEGVVIIGGYPSVWQKSLDLNYAFETRQRFKIDWTHGFDAAIVKAGTYQLQTIVLGGGNWAAFGGFKGLGAASGPVIASFEVGAGEVVYVGDLEAEVLTEGYANCAASLSVKDSARLIAAALPKQIPYLQREPKTSLMTITESLIRFPCGEAY